MRAQIHLLARLLRTEPSELAMLEAVPDEELRTLYEQLDHYIWAQAEPRLARVAGLTSKIPGPVAGRLAQAFLPPMIGARVAAHLSPAKARDLVGRLAPEYAAELAAHLDVPRCLKLLAVIPAEVVAELARRLAKAEDYLALAQLTPAVSDEASQAAVAAVPVESWRHVVGYFSTTEQSAHPNIARVHALL